MSFIINGYLNSSKNIANTFTEIEILIDRRNGETMKIRASCEITYNNNDNYVTLECSSDNQINRNEDVLINVDSIGYSKYVQFIYEDKKDLYINVYNPEDSEETIIKEDCSYSRIISNLCKDYIITEEELYGLYEKIEEEFLSEYYIGEHYFIETKNAKFEIGKYSELKNYYNSGIFSVNLGECENILKKAYEIPSEKSLFLFKISFNNEKLYEIYHPITLEWLDLSLCKDNQPKIIDNNNDINEDSDITTDSFNTDCNGSDCNKKDIKKKVLVWSLVGGGASLIIGGSIALIIWKMGNKGKDIITNNINSIQPNNMENKINEVQKYNQKSKNIENSNNKSVTSRKDLLKNDKNLHKKNRKRKSININN